MNYPIDYITYEKDDKIPSYVETSLKITKDKGFYVLPITPDNYNDIPAYHAGFKHMRDITIPKIKQLIKENENIEGFFIGEGDLLINDNYNFDNFLKENHEVPIWLGYKKKLKDYIVGNFLLYFPISHFEELEQEFQKQTRLIYSDRFFTKLYRKGFIKLKDCSVAKEIEHWSNVINAVRKQ